MHGRRILGLGRGSREMESCNAIRVCLKVQCIGERDCIPSLWPFAALWAPLFRIFRFRRSGPLSCVRFSSPAHCIYSLPLSSFSHASRYAIS